MVSSLTSPSLFSSVPVMLAMLATISSTEDEDIATEAACVSMLPFKFLIVRIISSIVDAVSVTDAA